MTDKVIWEGGYKGFWDDLDNALGDALDLIGVLYVEDAQKRSPVKTGTMMRSVRHQDDSAAWGIHRIVLGPGPEAPYAKYTELPEYMPKTPGPISRMKRATMPWLLPAARDSRNRQDALKILITALDALLQKNAL